MQGSRRCRIAEILVVTSIALPLLLGGAPGVGAAGPAEASPCDVHRGPCRTEIDGSGLILDITPKPVKAMSDLTFTLRVDGAKISGQPYVDLEMAAMYMGPNRVELQPQGPDRFRGTGLIVR